MQELLNDFKHISFKKKAVDGLSWLDDDQKAILKQTMAYIDKDSLLSQDPYSYNAVDVSFHIDEDETILAHLQNIKLDENTRIEINTLSHDTSSFNVKVFSLNKTFADKFEVRLISNLGGEIIKDDIEELSTNALDNPDLYEILSELTDSETKEVSSQAWYDPIPCVGNGCCVIKEALYPGGTPNFPISYKWCGAGCGSGTPVNSTDTCCRTHDNCYGSFKSYPDRCACDKNLINCVSRTGTRAASFISLAFKAKMKGQKC